MNIVTSFGSTQRRPTLSSQQIATALRREYAVCHNKPSTASFISIKSHSLVQEPGSGRHSKLSPAIYQIVEAKMPSYDETTATQLQHVLNQSGFNISLATIKQELGWKFQGSRYCQLIRDPNPFRVCSEVYIKQ